MSSPRSDPFVPENDEALEALLRAGESDARREIEHLVLRVARPLIEAILARYKSKANGIPEPDLEDIAATVHLRLVAKLRDLREGTGETIRDFENYVAVLTYNAVNDYHRKQHPERTRLKTRLRHALERDSRLAMWRSDGHMVCGLRDWEGAPPSRARLLEETAVTTEIADHERAADALVALFRAAGAPVSFDRLVEFTAALWRVVDLPPGDVHALATPSLAASRFETREYLCALWPEIRDLRPMQRKALLLNLRSGDTVNVVALFVLTGIASFDEVADALEMQPEELTGLWNELPLDDLRIAAMLGMTRQQVINLRKSGRERLARRVPR